MKLRRGERHLVALLGQDLEDEEEDAEVRAVEGVGAGRRIRTQFEPVADPSRSGPHVGPRREPT